MTVPYTFGTATTSIPLSNLDANFNTPITLGNTSIYLGNTTTTIGNLTLTNVTISSGTANITSNITYATANAVVFTNSSSIGTTSANLTFNGSLLNVAGQVTATGGIFKANGAPALSAATAGEAILAPEGTYGAFLYGRGTTYDVALGQRSTGVALGVLAGTNNVTFPGLVGIGTSSPAVALDVTGQINNTAGVLFNGSDTTSISGQIKYLTGSGLTVYSKTGSSFDFTLLGAAGNNIMRIPTGTINLSFPQADVNFTAYGIGLGGASPSSGTGITFPATQSASSNANTLDDYEEGTWTPTQGTFDTWVTPTFSATYTKIGRLVTVFLTQQSGTIGWSASDYMGGLPFTVGTGLQGIGYAGDTTPVSDNGYVLADSNSTLLFFNKANAAELSLCFTVSYQV